MQCYLTSPCTATWASAEAHVWSRAPPHTCRPAVSQHVGPGHGHRERKYGWRVSGRDRGRGKMGTVADAAEPACALPRRAAHQHRLKYQAARMVGPCCVVVTRCPLQRGPAAAGQTLVPKSNVETRVTPPCSVSTRGAISAWCSTGARYCQRVVPLGAPCLAWPPVRHVLQRSMPARLAIGVQHRHARAPRDLFHARRADRSHSTRLRAEEPAPSQGRGCGGKGVLHATSPAPLIPATRIKRRRRAGHD